MHLSAIPIETTRQKHAARGFADKNGRMQVAVRMDEDTLEAIHTLAQAQNISFAAQVRLFLSAGLKLRAAAREVA